MYAQDARAYIEKLIRLQKKMNRKGFVRADYPALSASMQELMKYLKYYRYETDEQMAGFWRRHRNQISLLLPRPSHVGYKKLKEEFEQLNDRV